MVYVYHIFSINLPVEGHLGCFHSPTIVSRAAMNTAPHVAQRDKCPAFSHLFPRSKASRASVTTTLIKKPLYSKWRLSQKLQLDAMLRPPPFLSDRFKASVFAGDCFFLLISVSCVEVHFLRVSLYYYILNTPQEFPELC